MVRKIEIATGVASALCFIGAIDTWFGTGTAAWLADLCLTDPDASIPDALVMSMDDHSSPANGFLAGGFAFLAVALGYDYVERILPPVGAGRRRPEAEVLQDTLLAMLYVAAAAGRVNRGAIESAFAEATGQRLGPDEARAAWTSICSRHARSLDRLLEDQRSTLGRATILRGTIALWRRVGMDSAPATACLEGVVAGLGYSGDAVCRIIDGSKSKPRSRGRGIGDGALSRLPQFAFRKRLPS